MTEDQQVIKKKMVMDLGFNVLHLKDGVGEVFHIGVLQLPSDGQAQTVTFVGVDVTHMFTTLRRNMTADQIAHELDRWEIEAGRTTMKFPLNSDWRVYSK